jgi:cytochrome c-type biogenesis protein CcmE
MDGYTGESRPVGESRMQSVTAGGRLKYVIGGTIIILVLAWLVLSNIQGASAHYLTVEELLAQGSSDTIVRVSGLVVDETIDWDSQQLILRFEIADDGGSLPVVYEGVRPDMLRDGAETVVEGRYSAGGVFEASTLLLKCPSKYAEE